MPKFGLKCFAGSFVLSLVAVFAVTKAYFVISADEHQQREALVDAENVPVKNIELFAATEENDPLYDKFNSLVRQNELPAPDNSEMITSENHSDTSSDSVLYEPENSESALTADAVSESEFAYSDDNNDSDYIVQAASSPIPQDADTASEDLQIADASEATDFMIPLVHTYKTAAGTVTYSDTADDNQIAMASHDINIDNLGNEGVAAVTDPLPESSSYISKSEFSAGLSAPSMEADNTWNVAEISNRHAGKNSLAQYTAKHETDIVAPDQQAEVPAAAEYRMQQNILIPIPESIKNEHNLTPQFSTSEENLRLERELRAKHQLPALENDHTDVSDDGEQDFEEEFDDDEENEETSKSLTDSIAEWFSGSGKKTSKDNIAPKSNSSKSTKKKSDKKEESSIFNKLLGIGKSDKDSVAPSELKLSFQPNRAEISGQTLEWLHAFSDNVIKDENVFIEIRIDKTAPYALQEKRLKLLYKILANNGVDYHKINIIFTDREPNSFIIRNVRYASEDDKIKAMKRADNPWY